MAGRGTLLEKLVELKERVVPAVLAGLLGRLTRSGAFVEVELGQGWSTIKYGSEPGVPRIGEKVFPHSVQMAIYPAGDICVTIDGKRSREFEQMILSCDSNDPAEFESIASSVYRDLPGTNSHSSAVTGRRGKPRQIP
jgi:hypothetical protein